MADIQIVPIADESELCDLERDSVHFEREMLIRMNPSLSQTNSAEFVRARVAGRRVNTAPYILLTVSMWAAVLIGVFLVWLGLKFLLYKI